jgi:hypothetical protein
VPDRPILATTEIPMPSFLRRTFDALMKGRHAIGLLVASGGAVLATATQLAAPAKGTSAVLAVLALAASDFDQALAVVRAATPKVRALIDAVRGLLDGSAASPKPPTPPTAP